MRRFLLDTNMAADCIFRRRGIPERVKQARAAGDKIGIGMPILAELYAGAENSATREKNLEILRRNMRLFRLWPFSADAAREYGRLFAALRRMGRPMQTADIQIAAIAITLSRCTVVSADTDLSAVPGLSIENWSS
jgi:tRNA(fMet)-specific endonuclease VapC